MSRITAKHGIKSGSIALGVLAAAFSVGCSSTQQPTQSAWSKANNVAPETQSVTITNRTLAAGDQLGVMVFGESAVVAKPRIPSHWILAEASSH